jgi:type IV secretory pathway TraG/TraD family ATPase VirD4
MQWLIESGEEDMAFMPVFQSLQQLTSYGEEVAA